MPIKSANHLTKILNVFHSVHGGDRFPVDVDKLALGAHEIFQWSDPIAEIQQADIKNFEGMLACNEEQSKWLIVYNASLASQGRIRFTKAHELGHYILHRKLKQEFMCSREDMLAWSGQGNIEAEADTFASYLLMPLDDFRAQTTGTISLDMFSHCADRYGVSLTAAILKWLSYTEEKAVLIMSNDGFINWASSSTPAYKAGAYFKTRNNVIPVTDGSLTANDLVTVSTEGEQVSAKRWFPHADTDAALIEMKMYSEQYDSTLTLLILPRYAEFWPPLGKPTSS
ncbi:MAG: ImmA/IrrE family metallo-endopeptidase [Paraglaciecola chathamensis]